MPSVRDVTIEPSLYSSSNISQIHNPGDRRAASGTSLVHGDSIDYFNLSD
ncbi:hypothetical protein PspLS_10114 [Pyricularia sp. CBS 133598]|nr:hypothetical protein PspLS_10114 [Pyricularia sp. CBS 133598]